MKHIDAAWIEQILKFDNEIEIDEYLKKLEDSRQRYAVVSRNGTKLRVRKQYNKNWFPKKEGE